MALSLEERFWAFVPERPEHGCWEWEGWRNEQAYGRFSIDGRAAFAHRIAHALAYGSVPSGALVRHLCNNPSCVRPSHLRLGTNLENARDRVASARRAGGHLEQRQLVAAVKAAVAFGMSPRDVALVFDVRESWVQRVIKRRRNARSTKCSSRAVMSLSEETDADMPGEQPNAR